MTSSVLSVVEGVPASPISGYGTPSVTSSSESMSEGVVEDYCTTWVTVMTSRKARQKRSGATPLRGAMIYYLLSRRNIINCIIKSHTKYIN